jgi:hypothetical protein
VGPEKLQWAQVDFDNAKRPEQETLMPRSTHPFSYEKILFDIKDAMMKGTATIAFSPERRSPEEFRRRFYAFRRSWERRMKDTEEGPSVRKEAKMIFWRMLRYECLVKGSEVLFFNKDNEAESNSLVLSQDLVFNQIEPPQEQEPEMSESEALEIAAKLLEKRASGEASLETLYPPTARMELSSEMNCSWCGEVHDALLTCEAKKDSEAKRLAEEQLRAQWRLEREAGETRSYHDWLEHKGASERVVDLGGEA